MRATDKLLEAIADIQRHTEGQTVPSKTDVIVRAVFELRDRIVGAKKAAGKKIT